MIDKLFISLGTGFMLLVIVAVLTVVIGWFMNIYNIIGIGISEVLETTQGILMVLGIFAAPLGSFMGWINLFQ